MIDLGNVYFCCDECPICEGLMHRLALADEFGEFQYDYCGCDKTVESKMLYNGGGCSDWMKPKDIPAHHGNRFVTMLIVNAAIHALIDDQKANRKTINLWNDQLFHMMQISLTFVCFV